MLQWIGSVTFNKKNYNICNKNAKKWIKCTKNTKKMTQKPEIP